MSSRSSTFVPSFLLVLSAVACVVSAQTASEPSATAKTALEAAFTRADINNDSKLSKEEAERLPAISARFAEFDTNGDGSLSLAEFAAGANTAP